MDTEIKDPNILAISGENFTTTFQKIMVVVTFQDF